MEIIYKPIGTVRSPFRMPAGTPIQPAAARGVRGEVQLLPEYQEGLRDLEGFSHITLLYHFHLARAASLLVKPFMDDVPHGVFATRAPNRPNSIGLSTVRLLGIEGNLLRIQDVDIVDGTPLLDIKPYAPEIDARHGGEIGWMSGKIDRLAGSMDDGRFAR